MADNLKLFVEILAVEIKVTVPVIEIPATMKFCLDYTYQRFRLNLRLKSDMIIFRTLSTTFIVSDNLGVAWVVEKVDSKIKPSYQVKLV